MLTLDRLLTAVSVVWLMAVLCSGTLQVSPVAAGMTIALLAVNFAGMVTGIVMVALLMLSKHDPFMGVNAGFVALCFNVAATGAVSLLTSAHRSGFEQDFASSPAEQPGDNREPV